MEVDNQNQNEKSYSQLLDSQTQKVDSDCDYIDVDEDIEKTEDTIWGRLYPVGFNLSPLDLTKKLYRIGRGPDCDVQITGEHVNSVMLPVISKVHFQIELENNSDSRIFSLLDMSSNGTYVNRIKIGKNKKTFLSHNDEISISLPQNRAYLFIDPLTYSSWLPLSERRNYSIIMSLGQGAFGEVQLAIEKRSGKRYAIKRISRSVCQENNSKNHIANEIKILSSVNSQFTIRMEDLFENDDAVFIILEYMPGGDLQKRIDKVKFMTEKDSKFYFYQLMLGLQYLHNIGIIHRDLKPKNVLLSSDSPDSLLKISDFGLSKMKTESALKTFCGTLLFTAPEIILSKGCTAYTPLVDVWSLGCILYSCLKGKPPFDPESKAMPLQEQIVRGYFPRIGQDNQLSDNVIDLVNKMLAINATQRIAVDGILEHPWLQDKQMKSRLKNVLADVGKENLENVSTDFENAKKRRRSEQAVTMTPS